MADISDKDRDLFRSMLGGVSRLPEEEKHAPYRKPKPPVPEQTRRDQQAVVSLNKGEVQITESGPTEHCVYAGAHLARFLIGSDEPEEIIQQAEMECTGEAALLVSVLFPNLHPMMSH